MKANYLTFISVLVLISETIDAVILPKPCEYQMDCPPTFCCGLIKPINYRYGKKAKLCLPEGAESFEDPNGYSYEFACGPSDSLIDRVKSKTKASNKKEGPVRSRFEQEEIPTSEEGLFEYLKPTPEQFFSDAEFFNLLEFGINMMLLCSLFGTFLWPIWVLLGLFVEIYNYVILFDGLWLVFTVTDETYGHEVVTFWNWLFIPARWAIINSFLYWTGVFMTIPPLVGFFPSSLMWLNMFWW